MSRAPVSRISLWKGKILPRYWTVFCTIATELCQLWFLWSYWAGITKGLGLVMTLFGQIERGWTVLSATHSAHVVLSSSRGDSCLVELYSVDKLLSATYRGVYWGWMFGIVWADSRDELEATHFQELSIPQRLASTLIAQLSWDVTSGARLNRWYGRP